MAYKWLNEIVFCNESDKKNLISWCEFIGYSRYYDLYNLIKKYKTGVISYELLSEVAKYDFHLSDQLHSMLKFFELRIRAFICNKYGTTVLTRENYLYEFADVFTQGAKHLPCDTYYEKRLGESCTIADFLNASSMETLLKIFLSMDDAQLSVFGAVSSLSEICFFIKELRNSVAHGKVLVGSVIKCKGKMKPVKELYFSLLSYMPTDEMREKRLKYIQELNSQFLLTEDALLRKHLIVEP